VLVYDTFTDANGTSLDAHTPDICPAGSAWREDADNWDIQSNRANHVTINSGGYATIDSGKADVTASVTLYPYSGGMPGLVLRFTDTTHTWVVQAGRGSQDYRIYEVNGSSTLRAFAAVTVGAGPHALAVVASGTTIAATFDAANPISYASATLNQTVTRHGIKAYKGTDRLDDLTIAG
jgi:hypothetical protein